MHSALKQALIITESIGHDLGIIAATNSIDLTTLHPELNVKLDSGRPHIKCVKGVADALDLYVDRKDGAGFVLLGRLIKTDYIDIAEVPAATPIMEWDYKAKFVIGNDTVGMFSDVKSIVVKRQ